MQSQKSYFSDIHECMLVSLVGYFLARLFVMSVRDETYCNEYALESRNQWYGANALLQGNE